MRDDTNVSRFPRLVLFALTLVAGVLLQQTTRAVSSPEVIRFNGGRSDRAAGLTIDSLGNWYVPAYVERTDGKSGFAVVKHNASGAVAWVATYNGASGAGDGAALAVHVDAGGNVYAAGYLFFNGTTTAALDYLVVKFNANGVQQWSQRYNGPGNYYDQARFITVDSAGRVFVSGRSYGTSFDFTTLRLSATGAIDWVRRFDGPVSNSDDDVVDMALDSSGNVIVMGRIGSTSGAFGNDVAIVRYGADGAPLGQTFFSETAQSDDVPADMEVDAGNNVIITGVTSATASPEQEMFPFLLKYGPDGNLNFFRKDASAGGGAVVSDAQGNIYVSGSSAPVFATPFSSVAKFTAVGSLVWQTPIPETFSSGVSLYKLVLDPSGALYTAGVGLDRSTSGRDFLTIKLTPSGSIAWRHLYNGTGAGNDEVTGLVLDASANVLVTGTSWGGYVSSGGTAEDIVTLRFANGSTPASQKPAAPANLSAQATTATQVTLRWDDRSSDENGFRVERCTGGPCTNFAQIAQVGAGATTYRDSTAAKSTKYTYRLTAFNDAGASAASNTASVQTPKK